MHSTYILGCIHVLCGRVSAIEMGTFIQAHSGNIACTRYDLIYGTRKHTSFIPNNEAACVVAVCVLVMEIYLCSVLQIGFFTTRIERDMVCPFCSVSVSLSDSFSFFSCTLLHVFNVPTAFTLRNKQTHCTQLSPTNKPTLKTLCSPPTSKPMRCNKPKKNRNAQKIDGLLDGGTRFIDALDKQNIVKNAQHNIVPPPKIPDLPTLVQAVVSPKIQAITQTIGGLSGGLGGGLGSVFGSSSGGSSGGSSNGSGSGGGLGEDGEDGGSPAGSSASAGIGGILSSILRLSGPILSSSSQSANGGGQSIAGTATLGGDDDTPY